MRSVVAAVVLCVALVLTAVPAAAVGEFSLGSWSGAAYFKDGKFFRCAMRARYINGWDLFFSIDPAGYFSVLLRSQRIDMLGEMLFGTKVALRMQIDDTPLVVRPFTAISPQLIETKFATNLDFVQRLSTGKVLRVNSGSKVWRFPLTDAKEAMPLLHACAAKYRNG